jgi:hypothetical protein
VPTSFCAVWLIIIIIRRRGKKFFGGCDVENFNEVYTSNWLRLDP